MNSTRETWLRPKREFILVATLPLLFFFILLADVQETMAREGPGPLAGVFLCLAAFCLWILHSLYRLVYRPPVLFRTFPKERQQTWRFSILGCYYGAWALGVVSSWRARVLGLPQNPFIVSIFVLVLAAPFAIQTYFICSLVRRSRRMEAENPGRLRLSLHDTEGC